jgi:Uma2 family endonuclease
MARIQTSRTSKPRANRPTITDKAMFEIVDGRLVEMEPMSVYSVRIAALIYGHLFHYCQQNRIGEATIENLFRLPLSKPRSRRPDVAFVSSERWQPGKSMPISGESWDVVPNLAVEVISPSDRATVLERKLDEYFEAGVQRVWVIHPEQRIVKVYKSRHDSHVLRAPNEITDEEILPGFRLPVGSIFPPSDVAQ